MKYILLLSLFFASCDGPTYMVDKAHMKVYTVESWGGVPFKKYKVYTDGFDFITDSVYKPGDTVYIDLIRNK